jgi:hypothetical protein
MLTALVTGAAASRRDRVVRAGMGDSEAHAQARHTGPAAPQREELGEVEGGLVLPLSPCHLPGPTSPGSTC